MPRARTFSLLPVFRRSLFLLRARTFSLLPVFRRGLFLPRARTFSLLPVFRRGLFLLRARTFSLFPVFRRGLFLLRARAFSLFPVFRHGPFLSPADPVNLRIPPQPGQLPLGVLPGSELHLLQSLRLVRRAVQHPQQLLIANGLKGRGVPGDPAVYQGPYLVQQACRRHGVHPPVNQAPHVLPVGKAEANPHRVIPGRKPPRLPVVLRDGFPRLPPDLQGPKNPLFIRRVEALRRLGVHGPQLLQKGGDAPGFQLPLQLRPDGPASLTGGEGAAPDHRLQPQPCAPYQNGQLPPPEDIVHNGDGGLRIPGGGPALPGVRHGDHMMGHAAHLRLGGGGGADGHAPVNLHGVGGDHLAAESLGQQHTQGGLAAGSGAHHADNLPSVRHGRQNSRPSCRALSQAASISAGTLPGSRSSPPANTWSNRGMPNMAHSCFQ